MIVMKKPKINSTITAVIALAICPLLPSCVTAYSVISEVQPDGSMVKTVFAKADSACLSGDYSKHPFIFDPSGGWEMSVLEPEEKFDFIGDGFIHNFIAVRNYKNPSETSEKPASEEQKDLPYLKGEEEWNVRKGFFSNRYTYMHSFPGIGDTMPISLGKYLNEEEAGLWLESGGLKDYGFMNGVEMYSLILSGYFVKFQKWIYDCAIETRYRMIAADAGDTLTDSQKETLFSVIGEKMEVDYEDIMPSLPDPYLVASTMSAISGNQAFTAAMEIRKEEWEDILSEQEEALLYPFSVVYRYEAVLPGKTVSANTSMFDDGHPVWKVDGYRLLAGDMVLYAESVKVNVWSFILLGAITAAAATALLILKNKK